MQRVLILGSSGAGKSTFARRLSVALGLPVYHLDALFWKPGWVKSSRKEELEILAKIVAQPAWIIDGNYGAAGLLDPRLAAADTAIFLDLPRTLCLWRAVRRWLAYRGRTRPDMGPDCPEKLDLEFARWIWNYPARTRPRLLDRISAHPNRLRLIRLTTPSAIEAFVHSMEQRSLP